MVFDVLNNRLGLGVHLMVVIRGVAVQHCTVFVREGGAENVRLVHRNEREELPVNSITEPQLPTREGVPFIALVEPSIPRLQFNAMYSPSVN